MQLRRLLDPVVNLETPAPQVLDAVDNDINDEPPLGEVLDEVDNDIDDEQSVGEVVIVEDFNPLFSASSYNFFRVERSVLHSILNFLFDITSLKKVTTSCNDIF